MSMTLDAIDLKILDVMQRDASMSSSELADRVGLSQSPCWRRVQRLREEGYIKSVVATVDLEKLGFLMQIFAQVRMSTLTDQEREEFHRAVRNTPEILKCWTVFGEMDCLMQIVAPDVKWYQDFTFKVLLKLPGVVDIRSIVTLTETKNSTVAPVKVRGFA